MAGRRTKRQESDFHIKTGVWCYDLLIAIVHQARADAKKDERAAAWLQSFLDLGDRRHIPTKSQCKRRFS